MDGVSVAASIISIAAAGIQVSIKLVTLSTQISSAPERVSSIGNDVSLTSGVLHQLGELMTQKTTNDGIAIFSKGGLETTRTSAAMCERIFKEVENEVGRASEQLRGCKRSTGGKIKLSKAERLKWPFLQPSIDLLRADLREAKATLMLMLQVATLALSKKMADISASTSTEQGDMIRAVVAALQQQQEERSDRLTGTSSLGSASTKFGQEFDSKYSSDVIDPVSATTTESYTPRAREFTANTMLEIDDGAPSPRSVELPNSGSSFLNTMAHPHIFHARPKNTEDTNDRVDNTSRELSDVPSEAMDHLEFSRPISTLGSTLQFSGSGSDPDYTPSSAIRDSYLRDPLRLANSKVPDETGSELNMFMLKPVVKDYFDRVELSWSIRNPKMHVSAIKNYLAQMEADGMPSVIDMLETLSAHEHSIVDAHVADTDTQRQGSLLSLKRTKTNIYHLDILFKGVPGLQFVVEPAGGATTKSSIAKVTPPPLMPENSAGSSELQLRPKYMEESDVGDSRSPRKITQAGLSGAAVAGLVEHARSRSRDRNRSRSKSRIRQEVPVATAGLGAAAIAGLYRKNKAAKGARERRQEEHAARRGRRSRSRSRGYDYMAMYDDPASIEYGDQPVHGNSDRHDDNGRPDSRKGSFNDTEDAMAHAAAEGAPAANEAAAASQIKDERRLQSPLKRRGSDNIPPRARKRQPPSNPIHSVCKHPVKLILHDQGHKPRFEISTNHSMGKRQAVYHDEGIPLSGNDLRDLPMKAIGIEQASRAGSYHGATSDEEHLYSGSRHRHDQEGEYDAKFCALDSQDKLFSPVVQLIGAGLRAAGIAAARQDTVTEKKTATPQGRLGPSSSAVKATGILRAHPKLDHGSSSNVQTSSPAAAPIPDVMTRKRRKVEVDELSEESMQEGTEHMVVFGLLKEFTTLYE